MSIDQDDLPENIPDEWAESLGDIQDAGESEEMQEAKEEGNRAKLNLAHKAAKRDHERMACYGEEDLIARARQLASTQSIKFVHFKPIKDDFAMQALTTSDLNRMAVFDALFDFGSGVVPFPHKDTFKGRLVDHKGRVFTEKSLEVTEILHAVNAAGLENPTSRQVSQSYREWAQQHERDDLMDYFDKRMPEWDGVERCESYLIKLFKPFDNPLNRQVGMYFWLSLYCRLTMPGCQAPISISLIGGQNAGKSYFSKLLCEAIMNDKHATPIPLNLAASDYNKFLRNITGRSVIANVGEMTGFKKADIENMKQFATKTEDDLDFKFEDTMVKPRQWIIIMDGNEYSGMQRDDTGNRRFYPMFVGQIADKDGQPAWANDFAADLSTVKEDVWQLMAECKHWMEINGEHGYNTFVGETSKMVTDFSRNEMQHARGVIRDELLDNSLIQVLIRCAYERHHTMRWHVTNTEIAIQYKKMHNQAPFSRTMAPHMAKLGFEQGTFKNMRGYFLPMPAKEDGTADHNIAAALATLIFNEGDGTTMRSCIETIERARSIGGGDDF